MPGRCEFCDLRAVGQVWVNYVGSDGELRADWYRVCWYHRDLWVRRTGT
jgi:hypothetical protein